MQTVYKYPLVLVDEQTVAMPAGANILHVDMQADTLCLWALVNPAQPARARTIIIRGTEHVPHEPAVDGGWQREGVPS